MRMTGVFAANQLHLRKNVRLLICRADQPKGRRVLVVVDRKKVSQTRPALGVWLLLMGMAAVGLCMRNRQQLWLVVAVTTGVASVWLGDVFCVCIASLPWLLMTTHLSISCSVVKDVEYSSSPSLGIFSSLRILRA